jgi:hypothetical protein
MGKHVMMLCGVGPLFGGGLAYYGEHNDTYHEEEFIHLPTEAVPQWCSRTCISQSMTPSPFRLGSSYTEPHFAICPSLFTLLFAPPLSSADHYEMVPCSNVVQGVVVSSTNAEGPGQIWAT